MALISPMHPIWNRSSIFSLLPENRWITLQDKSQISFNIYFSCVRISILDPSEKVGFSSFVRSGSLEVFTPQISTLYPAMIRTSAICFHRKMIHENRAVYT